MWSRKIKLFVYLGFAVGSLVWLQNWYSGGTIDSSLLQNSLVSTLQDTAKVVPPDIGITNVSLKKISGPTDNFNFYKYKATVAIKNFGGDVQNAQVVLSGDGQKYIFVRNNPSGFSLQKDKSFILENYEMIFDANYNGGKIPLKLEVNGVKDYYLDNNTYEVEVFELPVKIDSIGINDISKDGTLNINFELNNFALSTNDFEVYLGNDLEINEEDEKYAEVFASGKVYSYFRVKNSQKIYLEGGWKSQEVSESDVHNIKFSDDPFTDDDVRYLFVKAVDKENGNFAISNILKLVPQKELDRAEFAKFFVDFAEIKLFTNGSSNFEDVGLDSWYGPYVQTLYNLGLINNNTSKFFPENPVTRGEVLRIVMDYFDADLIIDGGEASFDDVEETDTLYPYVEALHASGKAGVLRGNFHPDALANKHFLKYLINEYQENS